ncbi:phage tail tape measure protein [Novosphingobium album (ex Liu et al. 2023)]|uniref:Phage tail tape measure protein n=1 Tax=Novosphingobium album (ex Liu et al. 2023) TaxID=3031130 RepID=A0ABT5WPA1_9SPHN|nr:phage tail tape measure protein [Novosphingobium album (ex Liu et al. 2023)]MDE8651879.1 phage tail tape measure protein [Novosphingobium album (ex Liu et al. 2023)]
MSTLIGALRVVLGLDSAGFERGATAAERRARQLQRNIERYGRAMTDLGGKLSAAVTVPILAMGAGVIKASSTFESAMNRVSISTQGTAGEMKEMSDLALQLGKDTTFGASTSADAMDMLAKNGLTARQILDGAAKAAVDLASAAGSELEPAANAITDVMAQFGLTTKDLPIVVNQITGAVNESKLSFEDFTLAIGQGGGVAGAAGVDFADFATALASVSPLFASGSDAGTAFKTFLISLNPTTKKAGELMRQYGLKFYDAQGNLKSMAEVAEILKTKLGGLNEEARLSVMKEIFGTDALRVAIGLMNEGAAGLDRVRGAINKTDAAAQSAQRLKGFNGQLEQLKGAAETLAIRIGQSGLLQFVTDIVIALTGFVDKLSEVNPEVLRFATIMAALAATVGPALIIVGQLVQAFSGLAAARVALMGLSGTLAPMLPMIAVFVAAGLLIAANWKDVKPALSEAAIGLGELYDGFMKVQDAPSWTQKMEIPAWMTSEKTSDLRELGEALRSVYDWINRIWDTLDQAAADANVAQGQWIDQIVRDWNTLTTVVPQYVSKMVTAIRTWVVDKLGQVWGIVTDKIDTVKRAFFGLYDAVVGHSYIPDMVDGIAAQMDRLDAVMVDKAKVAAKSTQEAFMALAEQVQPILDRLFPEVARLREYQRQVKAIAASQGAGQIDGATADEARRRLSLEYYGLPFQRDDVTVSAPIDTAALQKQVEKMTGFAWLASDNIEAANVRIVKSFKDTADATIGALQRMADAIKGGGFLDILGSVIGFGLQLGSIGAFGGKIAASINASSRIPAYAAGTSFHPGGLALVGERGPELVNMRRGASVIPNHKLGGVTNNYFSGNLMTPEFWAQIEARDTVSASVGAKGGAALAKQSGLWKL